jgi:hypothetical protein
MYVLKWAEIHDTHHHFKTDSETIRPWQTGTLARTPLEGEERHSQCYTQL